MSKISYREVFQIFFKFNDEEPEAMLKDPVEDEKLVAEIVTTMLAKKAELELVNTIKNAVKEIADENGIDTSDCPEDVRLTGWVERTLTGTITDEEGNIIKEVSIKRKVFEF